jgi:hypothetical protein
MPEILSIPFPAINLNPMVPFRYPQPNLSILLQASSKHPINVDKLAFQRLVKYTTQNKTRVSQKNSLINTEIHLRITTTTTTIKKDKLKVTEQIP